MKKHKIKLFILSDKQLLKPTKCNKFTNVVPYKDLCFYIDGNNIAITKNAKGICKNCKN